jgi:hypothetical protein
MYNFLLIIVSKDYRLKESMPVKIAGFCYKEVVNEIEIHKSHWLVAPHSRIYKDGLILSLKYTSSLSTYSNIMEIASSEITSF